jgi:magnesium-transporting ATPase (P-type)
MGEENCLPTVEESTEPPIRALRSGNDHGPPTIPGQQHHTHVPEEGPPKSLPSAHTLTAAQVAKELGVDIQCVPLLLLNSIPFHIYNPLSTLLTSPSHGLTATEAESRLRLFGPNKVKGAEGLSLWAILLRQVSNSLTLVCASASMCLLPFLCAFLIGLVRLPTCILVQALETKPFLDMRTINYVHLHLQHLLLHSRVSLGSGSIDETAIDTEMSWHLL